VFVFALVSHIHETASQIHVIFNIDVIIVIIINIKNQSIEKLGLFGTFLTKFSEAPATRTHGQKVNSRARFELQSAMLSPVYTIQPVVKPVVTTG